MTSRAQRIGRVAGGTGVAVAIAALVTLLVGSAERPIAQSDSAETNGTPVTVKVDRVRLERVVSGRATLQSGDPFTVAVLPEGGPTVVEWAAPQGSRVSVGEQLVRTLHGSVVLLRGDLPLVRELSGGTSGLDVEQLQESLAELDLYGGRIDGVYGPATANAALALGIAEPPQDQETLALQRAGLELDLQLAQASLAHTTDALERQRAQLEIRRLQAEITEAQLAALPTIPAWRVIFSPQESLRIATSPLRVGDVFQEAATWEFDLGRPVVSLRAPQAAMSDIMTGDEVTLVIADHEYSAVVQRVDDSETDDGLAAVSMTVNSPSFELEGGAPAELVLDSTESPVLTVPSAALGAGRGRADASLTVIEEGLTRRIVDVEVGLVVDGRVEVVPFEGFRLTEGDPVIVE